MARPLSVVAPAWWDYTTLHKELIDDAAKLTPEDMLGLSRPGFEVRFYDTLESFYLAEALEYIEAWQQATEEQPTGICGPIGPTEQLPLVAQLVNELELNLRHAHFWGMDEWYLEGREVSLDDIEHRILRPIWRDPLVHYALNCASIGCPELQPEPFTVDNSQELLEQASRKYVAHSRGVKLSSERLTVSSIYIWFKEDFGGTDKKIIEHLMQYAGQDLAKRLQQVGKISDHSYDWSLNQP